MIVGCKLGHARVRGRVARMKGVNTLCRTVSFERYQRRAGLIPRSCKESVLDLPQKTGAPFADISVAAPDRLQASRSSARSPYGGKRTGTRSALASCDYGLLGSAT